MDNAKQSLTALIIPSPDEIEQAQYEIDNYGVDYFILAHGKEEYRRLEAHLNHNGSAVETGAPCAPHVTSELAHATNTTADTLADKRYSIPLARVLKLADEIAQMARPEGLASILTKSNSGNVRTAMGLFSCESERAKILGLHIEANRQGLVAPYFRPQLVESLRQSGKGDHALSPAQSQLSNDMQFVDLHWVLCQRQRLRPGCVLKVGHLVLCNANGINLPALVEFVQSNATFIKRIRQLKLTEQEQWQLTKLQTQAIKKRKDRIRLDRSAVHANIADHAALPKSRMLPDAVPQVVVQWEALCIARGSAKDAANLGQLITGKHFDPQSAKAAEAAYRSRKQQLKEWLPPDYRYGGW